MRNPIIIKSTRKWLHVRVAQIHVVGMRNFLVLRRRSHLRHMARAINLTWRYIALRQYTSTWGILHGPCLLLLLPCAYLDRQVEPALDCATTIHLCRLCTLSAFYFWSQCYSFFVLFSIGHICRDPSDLFSSLVYFLSHWSGAAMCLRVYAMAAYFNDVRHWDLFILALQR